MSINTHDGFTQSRQDDLESLAYLLIDLLYPALFSKVISGGRKNIRKMKKNILQYFRQCDFVHKEAYMFVQYCQDLSFDAYPDYEYLKDLLKKLNARECTSINNNQTIAPDWIIKAYMIQEYP